MNSDALINPPVTPFVSSAPHPSVGASLAALHAFRSLLRATLLDERVFSSIKRITPVDRVILHTSSITSTTTSTTTSMTRWTAGLSSQIMFNNRERSSDSLFNDEEDINDLQALFL